MRLEIQPTTCVKCSTTPSSRCSRRPKRRGSRSRSPITRRGDRCRRSRSASADRLESAVERHQVHAAGRPGVRPRAASRRRGTDIIVEDTGHRHRAGGSAVHLRSVSAGDSSTTRSHGGVGLGLAIVRHLVELHGGSVDAVSRGRGRGTTSPCGCRSASPRHRGRVGAAGRPHSAPRDLPQPEGRARHAGRR